MKVKFYADNHNSRLVWSWVDGAYTTSDEAEITDLKALGLRFEEEESITVKVARAEDALVKVKQEKKAKKKPLFGKG